MLMASEDNGRIWIALSARTGPRARDLTLRSPAARVQTQTVDPRWDARSGQPVRAAHVRDRDPTRAILFVERRAHPEAATVQDVGVDHRGSDAVVAQQFLHRADVVTRPE